MLCRVHPSPSCIVLWAGGKSIANYYLDVDQAWDKWYQYVAIANGIESRDENQEHSDTFKRNAWHMHNPYIVMSRDKEELLSIKWCKERANVSV